MTYPTVDDGYKICLSHFMIYEAPEQKAFTDRRSSNSSSAPDMSTGERIVIVDDHAELAGLLAEALTLEGFGVRTAADGDTALAVIAEYKPLCVLTDIDMPGMNGFELAQRLRALYDSDIVLVAITGWGPNESRVAKEFDAFDHTLRKPIDVAFLRKLLRPA
jgi:DNA-binding response OmpR family regulator